MAKKKRKSDVITVDFTGVEMGGSSKVKPGEYVTEVVGVTQEEGADSGEAYLAWEFKITKGKYKGSKLYHNTSLQQQALWNLRGLLEAMAVEISEGQMDLDFDDLIGQEVGVSTEVEKYNGKNKSRIVGFFNAEDGANDDSSDDDDGDDDSDDDSDDDDDKDDDSSDDDSSDEDDDSDDDDDKDDDDNKKKGKKDQTSKKKKRR